MADKKIPVNFITDGIKVCGDKEGNDVSLVIVSFKDGRQLTFHEENANRFLLHYFNGLMMQEHTKIPQPEPVEWEEVARIQ